MSHDERRCREEWPLNEVSGLGRVLIPYAIGQILSVPKPALKYMPSFRMYRTVCPVRSRWPEAAYTASNRYVSPGNAQHALP